PGIKSKPVSDLTHFTLSEGLMVLQALLGGNRLVIRISADSPPLVDEKKFCGWFILGVTQRELCGGEPILAGDRDASDSKWNDRCGGIVIEPRIGTINAGGRTILRNIEQAGCSQSAEAGVEDQGMTAELSL